MNIHKDLLRVVVARSSHEGHVGCMGLHITKMFIKNVCIMAILIVVRVGCISNIYCEVVLAWRTRLIDILFPAGFG